MRVAYDSPLSCSLAQLFITFLLSLLRSWRILLCLVRLWQSSPFLLIRGHNVLRHDLRRPRPQHVIQLQSLLEY